MKVDNIPLLHSGWAPLALLAFSQDPRPIEYLPLLPECIYPPIMTFMPSPLSFDYIRFHIEHATNNFPGKQITLRPPHCVLHDMAQPPIHLKPYMEIGHFLDQAPPESRLPQPLFAFS